MKSQYLETMKDEWISNKEGLLSKAPLYHQLYSLLKTSILDGTLNYEDRMPTEQELSQHSMYRASPQKEQWMSWLQIT